MDMFILHCHAAEKNLPASNRTINRSFDFSFPHVQDC